MYYCPDCNKVYERDELYKYCERGEAWGSEYTITEYLCPICHDHVKCIDRVHYCDSCGQLCMYDYIETNDGNHYCSDCYTTTDFID